MMIVRNITENDVENIVRIENGCFPDVWTDAMWKSEIARPDFFGFILENEGEAVGFACATVLFEDAELPKIAVVPTHQGKGYGGMLLDALLQETQRRGGERMFLEVRISNVAALRLYEKRGFVKTRIREKYYADGEAAVEMCKSFVLP